MRINAKPAAASAAAAFLLLLLFHLTWPGPGIWLLIVGILIGLAAAYVWWRQANLPVESGRMAGRASPFADVGAYGLSGSALRPSRRENSGVPLFGVLAPVSILAILLFVGGAIGSTDSSADDASITLHENVSAIDRSGDGEPAAPQVEPPNTRETQHTQTTADSTTTSAPQSPTISEASEADSETTQQTATPVKPIVVAAPRAASPVEDETEAVSLVPESANTFEYTVEEGDTLYDIAERYNSTVDAIMNLNNLDASSFIHPGDVLLIPVQSEDSDAEES